MVDIWFFGIIFIEMVEGKFFYVDIYLMRVIFMIFINLLLIFRKLEFWFDDFIDFVKKCLVKNFE